MTIKMISCINQSFAIGKDNDLLYNIPADLKFFKEQTYGKNVVCSDKTYESLPIQPLPNRNFFILSLEGAAYPQTTPTTVEEILKRSKDGEEFWIIGGGSIYTLFLPYAHELYLTVVNEWREGDAYFPQFNPSNYVIEPLYSHHIYGDNGEIIPYSINRLARKQLSFNE